MSSEQSGHKRIWREYRTANGSRPVKEFLLALPDEDRAAIIAEMANIRDHGKKAARHIRGDIYEVRANYNTKAYRILFACQGRFEQVLLSLEGF